MTERHSASEGGSHRLVPRLFTSPLTLEPLSEADVKAALRGGDGAARSRWRPMRNGLPEPRPYEWRPGDAERDAEITARVTAIQAQVRGEQAMPP